MTDTLPEPTVRTRVALVNDYELVAQGLASLLSPYDEFDVVEMDLNHRGQEPVDVALFDTFATNGDGDAALRPLLDDESVGAVAVYTASLPDFYVQRLLGMGVRGALPKNLKAEELRDSLRTIHGGALACPGNAEAMSPGRALWPGKGLGLTQREAEVVALIVQGLSNNSIAKRLFISINTVKSYIRSAYRTMGVASRSEALLWALDHGFIAASARAEHALK